LLRDLNHVWPGPTNLSTYPAFLIPFWGGFTFPFVVSYYKSEWLD